MAVILEHTLTYLYLFSSLLEMVENLSSQRVTQLTDAMLLLEVVQCIRALMNDKVGLEYFITHLESSQQLVLG